MRVNIYAEELSSSMDDVEFVTKTVIPDGETKSVTFFGIRHYLLSPEALHHNDGDDDRSAITYWVRWRKSTGNDFGPLHALFRHLNQELYAAAAEDRRRLGRDR